MIQENQIQRKKNLSVFVILLLLVIGFQNCSDFGLKGLDREKPLSDPLSTLPTPPPLPTPTPSSSPASTPTPAQQSPCGANVCMEGPPQLDSREIGLCGYGGDGCQSGILELIWHSRIPGSLKGLVVGLGMPVFTVTGTPPWGSGGLVFITKAMDYFKRNVLPDAGIQPTAVGTSETIEDTMFRSTVLQSPAGEMRIAVSGSGSFNPGILVYRLNINSLSQPWQPPYHWGCENGVACSNSTEWYINLLAIGDLLIVNKVPSPTSFSTGVTEVYKFAPDTATPFKKLAEFSVAGNFGTEPKYAPLEVVGGYMIAVEAGPGGHKQIAAFRVAEANGSVSINKVQDLFSSSTPFYVPFGNLSFRSTSLDTGTDYENSQFSYSNSSMGCRVFSYDANRNPMFQQMSNCGSDATAGSFWRVALWKNFMVRWSNGNTKTFEVFKDNSAFATVTLPSLGVETCGSDRKGLCVPETYNGACTCPPNSNNVDPSSERIQDITFTPEGELIIARGRQASSIWKYKIW